MKHEPVLACLMSLPVSLAATTCLSQPREIGRAETVVPAVDSDMSGRVSQLEPGSMIFQDDVIRTYRIGATGLRFVDQTTLTVYPNSSIKLDRFVYNPDKTVSEVALSLMQGAFRLASGGPRTSEKYSLQTPHVILGIRGTVVHVFSDGSSSTVQALHGAFEGCSRMSGVCKLVRAIDPFNGARFWSDGRVELGLFSPNLGVRQASGGGSPAPASRLQQNDGSSIEPPTPDVQRPSPERAALPIGVSFSSGPAALSNPPRAVCFVRGTLILTDRGERRIEDLRVGDKVATHSAGFQAIRWIPKQIFRREHGRAWGAAVAPVAIEKDALGEGCPNRRLILSPDHSLFMDGALIPALLLVNGGSIRQIDYSGVELEYFNIELERHQVIYAHGVAVETYYPARDDSRERWSNFAEYSRAYPGEERRTFKPVAPVLKGGRRRLLQARIRSLLSPVVEPRGTLEFVRSRIAARGRFGAAGAYGQRQDAADIRLEAPSVAGLSGSIQRMEEKAELESAELRWPLPGQPPIIRSEATRALEHDLGKPRSPSHS
jgi:hypothetical protein